MARGKLVVDEAFVVFIEFDFEGETGAGKELLGCKKGAFIGALPHKKGLFEEASGGTLFLDEIGALEAYARPGNVRELKNGLERASVLTPPNQLLTVADLPIEI